MYDFEINKRVEKFLDKIDDKNVISFYEKITILQENPFSMSLNLDIKRLKSKSKNHFRLRIGKYRFVYEVIEV